MAHRRPNQISVCDAGVGHAVRGRVQAVRAAAAARYPWGDEKEREKGEQQMQMLYESVEIERLQGEAADRERVLYVFGSVGR